MARRRKVCVQIGKVHNSPRYWDCISRCTWIRGDLPLVSGTVSHSIAFQGCPSAVKGWTKLPLGYSLVQITISGRVFIEWKYDSSTPSGARFARDDAMFPQMWWAPPILGVEGIVMRCSLQSFLNVNVTLWKVNVDFIPSYLWSTRKERAKKWELWGRKVGDVEKGERRKLSFKPTLTSTMFPKPNRPRWLMRIWMGCMFLV